MMTNARVILCALIPIALSLVACISARSKADPATAETTAAPTKSTRPVASPPAGASELMQGDWIGDIYITPSDLTVKITATIEGDRLKIRDEYGGIEGAERDHTLLLDTGLDGSSLTVDITYDDSAIIELCTTSLQAHAFTLCCNLDDENRSMRPGRVQPCDSPGDYMIRLTRP